MDECRFDNWTRMLGAIQDRRTALKDLAAAGGALLSLAKLELGLAQEDEVGIEGCRLSGDRCDRNKQCCSNKCNRKRRRHKNKKKDGDKKRRHKRGSGSCGCLGNGKKCRKDAACCRGFCHQTEFRCRCAGANQTCNVDHDCCRGKKCRADDQGNKFCKGGKR